MEDKNWCIHYRNKELADTRSESPQGSWNLLTKIYGFSGTRTFLKLNGYSEHRDRKKEDKK